ncbi:DNA alkylation repair protein [Enterococcus faecium]|uniref:DNA alkylation repair protein n=1 Tax=Enterococcus faecium TaxID=1352 RepID=UPI0039082183
MTQLMLTWSKDSNLWVKRIALEFQLLLNLNCQIKLEKNYMLICNVLHEYF